MVRSGIFWVAAKSHVGNENSFWKMIQSSKEIKKLD
jgi:hypothetical protein